MKVPHVLQGCCRPNGARNCATSIASKLGVLAGKFVNGSNKFNGQKEANYLEEKKSSTHFDYVQEVRGCKSPKVDPPVTRTNKHQSPRQVWALAGGKPTPYLSTATMLCHAEQDANTVKGTAELSRERQARRQQHLTPPGQNRQLITLVLEHQLNEVSS